MNGGAIRASLSGKAIGFVPTMGNLHAGHLSLCERSRAENDITVVSIFINPTQFNQASDFELYPRTVEQDIEKLVEQGVIMFLCPMQQKCITTNTKCKCKKWN